MCPHFLKGCGGCTYWNISYEEELARKKADLTSQLAFEVLPVIKILPAPAFDLRMRFDVTLENGKLGLYSKNHSLIDLNSCPILHPELEKAFIVLREFLAKNPLPISKGSLRLRLSSDLKHWGLWLDFSNKDIKNLLEQKSILIELSEKFIIEIGQKKKRLDPKSFSLPQLKLMDPIPFLWFKTLEQELLCSISSFTQPSWITADLMTKQMLNWLSDIPSKKIMEYGCGIGQYTVPLLNRGYEVSVFESDESALHYLQLNVPPHLNFKVNPEITSDAVALVNPPRSGLKEFAEAVIKSNAKYIIYISCFPKTLAIDIEKLSEFYKIIDITLIDQFARTSHYETAVLLQRI